MKVTGTQSLFIDCERYGIVSYDFKNGEKNVEPITNSRVYHPSVCQELEKSIKQGGKNQKALHQVTEQRGGICGAESASHIPKRNQGYSISKKVSKADEDPLKKTHRKTAS